MSNLGLYQVGTTMAKKVGGPQNLALLFMGGGYLIGRVIEVSVKKGVSGIKYSIRKVRDSIINDIDDESVIYMATGEAVDKQGLKFSIGDKFRVLESDGDAILIEKLGDSNSPYFVSRTFLKNMSDYEG